MISPLIVASLFLLNFGSVAVHGAVVGTPVAPDLATNSSKVRTKSILYDFPRQAKLPTLAEIQKRNATTGTYLNADNIQGDILIGMKKTVELLYFFKINQPKQFKANMLKNIIPLITSGTQLVGDPSQQPDAILNIAFTATGMKALGVPDNLGDPYFSKGQFADADALGDPGTANWHEGFKGTKTHGVFILASDEQAPIDALFAKLQGWLAKSSSPIITETHRLAPVARPGAEKGHEHFGFLDGFGQPFVEGFATDVQPGFSVIPPGVLLLGEKGDPLAKKRPAWAKDGSFFVFRQLQEMVPEFNRFLKENAIQDPTGRVNLTQEEGAEMLGARFFGRWKSGAAVDVSPMADNPMLAADDKINDFDYYHAGFDLNSDQTHCPFAAHIRKVRPRADQDNSNTKNQIMRAGLPYGPELTDAEIAADATKIERGLAFVSYQSSLADGFRFQQIQMMNAVNVPAGKSDPTPGFDPMLGANNGKPRVVSGMNPFDPEQDIALPFDFIVSRGGDYFFSPSISALKSPFSS